MGYGQEKNCLVSDERYGLHLKYKFQIKFFYLPCTHKQLLLKPKNRIEKFAKR